MGVPGAAGCCLTGQSGSINISEDLEVFFMKRIRPALVLGACLIAMATLPSYAQNKLVMVTEAWAPFRINDSSAISGFSGIDIDIIGILERELGIKIEIQRHPWARALEMLRNGQADFCTGAAYTAERAQFMEYVPTSYFVVQPVFYAPDGAGGICQELRRSEGQDDRAVN